MFSENLITLEPFTEQDFVRLISWIKDEESLIQFAGPYFSYPLTIEQLQKYIADKTRIPLRVRLQENSEIVGHCELNYQFEIPRVSRILIGEPQYRNKGLGKQIVKQMLERIFEDPKVSLVDLYVFDWNKNAINCYSQLGFVVHKEEIPETNVGGKVWKPLKMTVSIDTWSKGN